MMLGFNVLLGGDRFHARRSAERAAWLQILSLIDDSPAGEDCVCDLTEPFDMTQPAISHQLRILVEANILRRDKRGNWTRYSINPGQPEPLRRVLPGTALLQPTS